MLASAATPFHGKVVSHWDSQHLHHRHTETGHAARALFTERSIIILSLALRTYAARELQSVRLVVTATTAVGNPNFWTTCFARLGPGGPLRSHGKDAKLSLEGERGHELCEFSCEGLWVVLSVLGGPFFIDITC